MAQMFVSVPNGNQENILDVVIPPVSSPRTTAICSVWASRIAAVRLQMAEANELGRDVRQRVDVDRARQLSTESLPCAQLVIAAICAEHSKSHSRDRQSFL